MNDRIFRFIATREKEALQIEIESQMELGGEGLEKEDWLMLEVNLNNLSQSAVEHEQNWWVAI